MFYARVLIFGGSLLLHYSSNLIPLDLDKRNGFRDLCVCVCVCVCACMREREREIKRDF